MLAAVASPTGGLLASCALAGLLGAALGAATHLLHTVLRKAPARAAVVAYPLLGAAAGYGGIAVPLGALRKLHGEHFKLAVVTLVGSVLVGALAGVLLAWSRHPAAPLRTQRLKPWQWLALGLLFGIVANALSVYEVTQGWLGGYPAAQHALFAAAWLGNTLAVLLALQPVRARAKQLLVAAGAYAAVSVLAVALTPASEFSQLARAGHVGHWVALVRWLSDWDRDGFSSWLAGGDCAPFDANVSPGKREVRGNGLDDNCRYGDAPALPVRAPAEQRATAPATSNVVLITVDALRADHTTPYGYGRDTTPHLAALASQGVRFENAYTSGGWTCLALTSMLAGVYPRRLTWKPVVLTSQASTGGRLLPFPWEGLLLPGEKVSVTLSLPAKSPEWWLPSALQRRGYRTVALTRAPLGKLFTEYFRAGWDQLSINPGADDTGTGDLAVAAINELKTPFFLWVHLFDAHDPQTEHAGVPTFGSTMLDRYDHELAAADVQIGRIMAALGNRADTTLIVTADHGEAFQWGFQFHGTDMLEDSVRIPLVVRGPSLASGVNASPASLVDVAPTILALTQTPLPPGLDGRDLTRLQGDEPVISDLFRVDEKGKPFIDQMSASQTSIRLLRDNLKQTETLVRPRDLRRPPGELPPKRTPAALVDALNRYGDSSGP